MAQLGIASRRESERMILAGRVLVNGQVVTVMGTQVSRSDVISVDGKTVSSLKHPWVYKLHKPAGYVTARMDPQGRPTVYDLLPDNVPFMAHVGRLDYNTEGLLLLTTDGELAAALLNPGSRVPRVYVVKVQGVVSRDNIKKIEGGISLDGRPTERVVVERLPSQSRHDWLRLTLFEGRNRHVRRIFESVGHHVQRLIRTDFGSITVDDLAPMQGRRLKPDEIRDLRALI